MCLVCVRAFSNFFGTEKEAEKKIAAVEPPVGDHLKCEVVESITQGSLKRSDTST